MTVMNLVDLGTNVTRDIEDTNPPIVLRREEFFRSAGTNRPDDRPPPWRDREGIPTNAATGLTNNGAEGTPPALGNRPWERDGAGRPRFSRPPWMGEDEYKALLKKQGVHSFLIVMSTQAVRTARDRISGCGSSSRCWRRCQ